MTDSAEARSPCRVDFAGGTLDIWPLGLLHRGAATVNVAVDLPVTVHMRAADDTFRVRQGTSRIEEPSASALARREETALVGVVAEALELHPVEIEIHSASPRGAGLGASSALTVALVAAGEELVGARRAEVRARAHLARDLEARLMGLPTGTQDHYPALLGGALEIRPAPGGEEVTRLAVDLEALAACLVVAYTGQSHFSAAHNWEVVRRRLDGDPETTALFADIAEVASHASAALERGDFEELGRLMSREWGSRRRLARGVSTERIEALLERARELGAWGGKACGAGGGGCLAVLCPPHAQETVASGLAARGAEILDARPTSRGLEVG